MRAILYAIEILNLSIQLCVSDIFFAVIDLFNS